MEPGEMLNYGLGIGAIFGMAVKKYTYAYMLFAALLGWNILSKFVGGGQGAASSFDLSRILTLLFSIILFLTVFYLVKLTINHRYIFENQVIGDLEFYFKSTNALVVLVFLLIAGGSNIEKQLEDMFPQCGNLILLLSLFLFTYLLGIMVINISIIVNKKITDG
jgi:hypothetical protein